MSLPETTEGIAGRPRTLIFLIPRLARGGMFSVLSEAWKRVPRGQVRVISQEPNALAAPHPTLTVPRAMGDPLRFPGAWVYSARVFRIARRAIRDSPSAAVLIPQDSLATGFGAVLAGRVTGTPVIVMDHGSAIVIRTEFFWRERLSRRRLSERLRQPFLRATLTLMHWVTCRLLTRAFLASAEAVDRFTADGVPADRIVRYHVPVDLERFHPADWSEKARIRERFGLPLDRVIAITVSRLTPEKGLDTVIDAVAAQQDASRPYLVLGGVGPLRDQLEDEARRLGVDASFLGAVPDDDVPELLRAADVFTYASRQGTNVPVNILEAMASGLVVIGSPQPPAVVEMLAGGRGFVVAADDAQAYAQALRRASAADSIERQRIGAAARRWVEANHPPRALDDELERVLAI